MGCEEQGEGLWMVGFLEESFFPVPLGVVGAAGLYRDLCTWGSPTVG